jgi:hypothetical protein
MLRQFVGSPRPDRVKRDDMTGSIQVRGVIRNGRVEVDEPINLPDGCEVTIVGDANGRFGLQESDRPMTPEEISQTLAAMEKVEPFDWTDEYRAEAEAWEKKVNDYTIANMDKGIEDVFR